MPKQRTLDWAKNVLIDSTNVKDIEQALTVISEASADLEERPLLQDASIFGKLLELYTTTYSSGQAPKELLRSIGNLVSDNETNRSTLVGNAECIRQLKGLLEHYTSDDQTSELPDFAVKVFFNLCNESPETQQQAVEQDIHEAVIDYVCKRTWNETDADEMLLSISTGLLAALLENKPSTGSSKRYTADFIGNVLRLPSLDHLDADSFLDTLSVASAYLQDEDFIKRTVQNKQVHLVWDILGLVEDSMRRECGDNGDADDEDEKQYRLYLNAFAQSLANISSLSDFNDNYNLEDDFINGLGRSCVPSDDHKQHASLLPGCACLMLGNLATSDEVSVALASKAVSIDSIVQELAISNESVFLNAAAGLLRHLAIPMANREQYFDDPEYLQNVAHLYTDVTLEQVQIAGLQLTRQMLTAMPERTQRFISQQDSSARASLPALLIFSTQTTSTATKLEIARFITTCLRTLQATSMAGKFDAPLKTLIGTPSILSPLVFAVKQPLASGVMQAQAEAWLALNLFVRVPGGAGVLATEVSQDEQVLSLLRNRIKKTENALVEVKDEAVETTEPVQDTRPDWVKEKERDNAILLVHDVLKAEDVSDDVKSTLRGLLKETEIRVR